MNPLSLLIIGGIIVGAGFLIVFGESLVTDRVVVSSSHRIQQFERKVLKSKCEWLRIQSLHVFQIKGEGTGSYTFDDRQFLNFLQFILDKVVVFILVYC